jgi:S-DNA-T family DNA segregation ATPase FtsK/SpoIIIE
MAPFSHVARTLKVGYGRAARIIDQLHLAGVLGPPDGSKPRDVLMGLEELARITSEKAVA